MYSLVRIAAVGMIVTVMAGCAMTPKATNTMAHVGTMPQDYEQTIREQLRRTLNDPDSVQDFRVSKPQLASCMIGPGQPLNGWRVVAHYNAKNAYGAYTGVRQSVYWFHGERLVLVSLDAQRCPEGWQKVSVQYVG